MKLNKIHQDLKEAYKEKKQVYLSLGFEFENKNEIERCVNIFRSGYWSVAPFAFESYNSFAIKLVPNNKLFNSQIVAKSNVDFWTVSPNLSSFITMSWLRFLNDIDIINEEIKEKWELLEKLSLPYRKYTDNLDSLNFLKEYISRKENLIYFENPSDHYTKVYLDFWNHYYNTLQQKEYVQLMSLMIENESYLPDFEIKDYGIWNTRVYNAIGHRAYNLIDIETEKKENHFWQSFIQPHGFDSTEVDFDFIPYATSSSFQLGGVISKFKPELGYFSKMSNHPLYEVGQILSKDKSTYNGNAHIEAAKTIDEELKDPVMAWDALVSAGYWSGVNFGSPNMNAWKAAIDLSEKHGWTEINEVLVDQLEFYNHYKDKI